jgi:Protein of unknown function (DUF3631)
MSDDKIVSFPLDGDERARLIRARVEWRAGQPESEWKMYLEYDAKKLNIEPAKLEELIKASIKDNQKQRREELGERREAERRQVQTERREREDQRLADRRAQAEAKERLRERAKAEKRERALNDIAMLPATDREAALKTLATSLSEDFEALKSEFETRLEERRERIRRGDIEAWGEAVDTCVLLSELITQIERYLVIHQKEAVIIMALWVMFAWLHDVALHSPILAITSADAGDSKTTACLVLARLTPRSRLIAEPTGPWLYRYVDQVHPTLVIDDADQLLPRKGDLTHIVNVSWTRGVKIPRMDRRTTGYVPVEFDPFCPKVLSGIDLMPHLRPATRTRCITINLMPKLAHERVAGLEDADEDEGFRILQSKLLRWSTDTMATIKQVNPAMPEGFNNRQEKNFRLLFAIADLAGGNWPKRARKAALKLSPMEGPSPGRRLLADLRALFAEFGKALTSEETAALLSAREESEWANYCGRGRPINKFEIAQLLKPYGIKPDNAVYRGGKQHRGYKAAWFERVWRHYLPPEGRKVVRSTPKGAKKPNG